MPNRCSALVRRGCAASYKVAGGGSELIVQFRKNGEFCAAAAAAAAVQETLQNGRRRSGEKSPEDVGQRSTRLQSGAAAVPVHAPAVRGLHATSGRERTDACGSESPHHRDVHHLSARELPLSSTTPLLTSNSNPTALFRATKRKESIHTHSPTPCSLCCLVYK